MKAMASGGRQGDVHGADQGGRPGLAVPGAAVQVCGIEVDRSGGANNGHTGGRSNAQQRAGGDSSGGDFAKVLKHLRQKQDEAAKKQEAMETKLEEVASNLGA
jgi:hypothetical protein